MSNIQPVAGKTLPNKSQAEHKKKEEHTLKGTFVSVMLLGAFIAVSWIGVFLLFINRN